MELAPARAGHAAAPGRAARHRSAPARRCAHRPPRPARPTQVRPQGIIGEIAANDGFRPVTPDRLPAAGALGHAPGTHWRLVFKCSSAALFTALDRLAARIAAVSEATRRGHGTLRSGDLLFGLPQLVKTEGLIPRNHGFDKPPPRFRLAEDEVKAAHHGHPAAGTGCWRCASCTRTPSTPAGSARPGAGTRSPDGRPRRDRAGAARRLPDRLHPGRRPGHGPDVHPVRGQRRRDDGGGAAGTRSPRPAAAPSSPSARMREMRRWQPPRHHHGTQQPVRHRRLQLLHAGRGDRGDHPGRRRLRPPPPRRPPGQRHRRLRADAPSAASSGNSRAAAPGCGCICTTTPRRSDEQPPSLIQALREFLWCSPVEVVARENGVDAEWRPGELYGDSSLPSARIEAAEGVWWVQGPGHAARGRAAGLRRRAPGRVRGEPAGRAPAGLSVDRNRFLRYDEQRVEEDLKAAVPALVRSAWRPFPLEWLWSLADSWPRLAQEVLGRLIEHDVTVAVPDELRGEDWAHEQPVVTLREAGCLPVDERVLKEDLRRSVSRTRLLRAVAHRRPGGQAAPGGRRPTRGLSRTGAPGHGAVPPYAGRILPGTAARRRGAPDARCGR
ncbi:hypothetical protein LT493_13105 [Streptomyces tricolor]|nr:hypothetical protein [Streptomyces tricolor]